MAGDPDNASVWEDADVYVAFDLDAEIPEDLDADFDQDWELVGLLDGQAGFADNVNQTRTFYPAWGKGAIKDSMRVMERTVSFTALERNEPVNRLARPGKTPCLIAFVTHEGDRTLRRISRKPATVARNGAVTDSESALTNIPLQAFIVPDTDVDPDSEDPYFIEQDTAATGS